MIRLGWARGPWDDEPDRLVFEHVGVPCLILRNPTTGSLNGYVGVPMGHPWHGLEYEQIRVEVHGQLTYADLTPDPEQTRPDGLWWVGFDCAHSGDRCPAIDALASPHLLRHNETYRTVDYVRAEVERLAVQAAGGVH